MKFSGWSVPAGIRKHSSLFCFYRYGKCRRIFSDKLLLSLQPHGVVEIRPAHSTSRTSNYAEPEGGEVLCPRRKSLLEARMLLPVAAALPDTISCWGHG